MLTNRLPKLSIATLPPPETAGYSVVLPTTPYFQELVRWPTGERLTFDLPKVSLVALFPPGTAGYSGPDRMYYGVYTTG